MVALHNSSDFLEELRHDASASSTDVYARFVHKIIERSVLPRKILMQSTKGEFEIVAIKGQIAGFQEFEEKSRTWVQYPPIESKQRAQKALELSAGEALKDGKVSLSMVSAQERAELAKQATSSAKISAVVPDSESEIVSLSDWKQGKSRNKKKTDVTGSPVLVDFFTSIKSKVKFVYLEDEADGKVQTSGASGAIDKEISAGLKPSITKWRAAILPSVGSAPMLLTMRSPSSNDSSLIFAVDGRQYLLAEFETKNFGVVAGLWIKASQSK